MQAVRQLPPHQAGTLARLEAAVMLLAQKRLMMEDAHAAVMNLRSMGSVGSLSDPVQQAACLLKAEAACRP